MMKNKIAHIGAPGSRRTTSGEVINTRPGPDETTDSIDELVAEAMFPKIENCSCYNVNKYA